MKHKLPSPITDENFNEFWDYANNKLVELKKKKLIRKILVFVTNIVFFLCANAVLLNALANLSSNAITAFLDTLGPLKVLLDVTAPIISHPELHGLVQALIYLAFLFVPTGLASAIVTLIVWYAYPVTPPNTRTEDKAADSKTFMDALFEVQVRRNKVSGITSFALLTIFVVEILVLSLMLFLFVVEKPELLIDDSLFKSILEVIMLVPSLTNLAPLLFVFLYGLYAVLNEVLSSLLRPLYKTNMDPDIEKDAKAYYYECNPEIRSIFEEEEHILQRAIEIKAKRKKEEEELLAKINYQNPIYKYIKMGITVLILIIAIIIAGNKLKSVDFDKLLNEIGIESIEGNTESTETETETEVNNE